MPTPLNELDMDIRTFFKTPLPEPSIPGDTSVLYGLSDANCCSKDRGSEKVANALLPVSYCMRAEARDLSVVLCKSNGTAPTTLPKTFRGEAIRFDTEQACDHANFVHPPPNDVCATRQDDGSKTYYESKVVLYKGKKTELILRQDCYSFNVLEHILLQNPEKRPASLADLLADTTLVEHPYMLMLMWRSEGIVDMDLVAFTDIAVLRMIAAAETERSKESIALINAALQEYATTGTMTYKSTKKGTVAHQKVSLFPLRDVPELQTRAFTFPIRSTDIVLGDVRPDISLWHEIEKSKLRQEIERLKRKCGETS